MLRGKTKQGKREGVGCYDRKDGQKCPLMRGQMTRIMLPRGSEPYKYQGKGKSIPDIWNSTCKAPGVGVCLTSEGWNGGQQLVKSKSGEEGFVGHAQDFGFLL